MTSATFWTRVEPRPRTEHWDESLEGRVHDPLWLLARQYQLGELAAEDAGAPVVAALSVDESKVTHYAPNTQDPWKPLDSRCPLEALVEREATPLDLAMRVRLGFVFADALDDPALIQRFRVSLPVGKRVVDVDGDLLADSDAAAHIHAAVANSAIDGGQVLELAKKGPLSAWFKAGGTPPLNGRQEHLTPAEATKIDKAVETTHAWLEAFRDGPDAAGGTSWVADRLEYRFSLRSAAGHILEANEYSRGEIDWSAFRLAEAPRPTAAPAFPPSAATALRSVPQPLRFAGMPTERFWGFEDAAVRFAEVDVDGTEMGKLLLTEFALVSSGDWFVVTLDLKRGALTRVTQLAVLDAFGQWVSIEPAHTPGKWSAFGMSCKSGEVQPNLLFVPPPRQLPQESAPLEEVQLGRDEEQNLALAAEETIQDKLGRPVRGRDVAAAEVAEHRGALRENIQRLSDYWRAKGERVIQAEKALAAAQSADEQTAMAWQLATAKDLQRKAFGDVTTAVDRYEQLLGGSRQDCEGLPPLPVPSGGLLPRYRMYGLVSEHLIPFAPVKDGAEGRAQVKLQRCTFPDPLRSEGKELVRIPPRGRILEPERQPFFLREEEVPRAGVRVMRTWKMARDVDGRAHLWIGRRKLPGRGELRSGIAFDVLKPPR